jgi:hypothetical protein
VIAPQLLAATIAAVPAGTSFRTPSRNIACLYAFQMLRCDILSGLRPEPRGRCELLRDPLHDLAGAGVRLTRAKRDIAGVDPQRVAEQIRRLALSFPETHEDEPWGETVFKVGANRMFAWMGVDAAHVRLTLKLTPEEREIAMLLPFVTTAR